jgi:regulator of sigma D
MPTTRSGNTHKASPASERRTGTQSVIDKLVAERTEMLTLYCRVAGLAPFQSNTNKKNAHELLQELCQVLVDYIAAGHFSLYERIVNGTERRREVRELAEQLYSRIDETTQHCLDFNDKYDSDAHFEVSEHFHEELNKLGEEIAARIELEDKLIAAMTR